MPEQPDLILTPFGENAPSGAIDTIPEQRSPGDPPQRASWQDGFPAVTMQPLVSGGIPPRGQDFNGVLNAISQHLAYLGAGGVYRWDDEVVARGGYSQGAVLQSDDGLSTYISAVDSNTINFNTTPSAIGNQWIPAGGASKANSSLTINAGAGLGGGGNLSANRTLFVDFASEEQAQELLISNKVISPLNLGQAIDSLRATVSEAQALESLTKILSPGRLGDAMNAHVLGMGQTWQNMNASRALNVTYTNTTGRTIIVTVVGRSVSLGQAASLRFSVDGLEVDFCQITNDTSSQNAFPNVSAAVPAGSSYEVTVGAVSADIYYWRELR